MEGGANGGTWSRAPAGAALAEAGSEAVDAIWLARTYGPEAGLGVLALMSLMMMMRVVRKAAPTGGAGLPISPQVAEVSGGEPILAVPSGPVGRAARAQPWCA